MAGVLFACSVLRAQEQYNYTNLGTLGGVAAYAYGINNNNTVVGTTRDSSNQLRAFTYSSGVMSDLGTLGGTTAGARAISNTGYIAGESFYVDGVGNTTDADRAFVIAPGGSMAPVALVPASPKTGETSYGFGVNDSGVVVGTGDIANGGAYTPRPFALIGGTVIDLGTHAGTANATGAARGVNSAGDITGYAQDANGYNRAFLYTGGTMYNIGTLGTQIWHESYAHAINDAGQITGAAINNNEAFHAFRYSGGTSGTWIDLGDLTAADVSYSEAYGINESGDVVGTSSWDGSGLHAFLYRDGVMYDLNQLVTMPTGYTLVEARSINDLGYIVGLAKDPVGNNVAFMLSPVPEPTLSALGLIAAFGICRRPRRYVGRTA